MPDLGGDPADPLPSGGARMPKPGIPLSLIATHRWSHRRLLKTLAADPQMPVVPPALDGVIMVTHRGPQFPRSGLPTAMAVARERDCPVLVLTSGPAAGPAPTRDLESLDPRVVVVEADRAAGALPTFGVDRLLSRLIEPATDPVTVPARGSSIGQARNLGLAIARASGWHRALFLDDDVAPATGQSIPPGTCTLDTAGLTLALKAMADGSPTAAVGWALEGFEDNSVVCRARTQVGDPQQRFIGGGALLTRCGPDVPFFPTVYNEDWLFLLALLCRPIMGADPEPVGSDPQPFPRDVVLLAGNAGQDPYEPFAPGRAGREELGDLLAEGLFSLLHADALTYYAGQRATGARHPFVAGATDRLYWREVVRRRRAMILDLRRRSRRGANAELRNPLRAALAEAQAMHERIFWTRPRLGRRRTVAEDAVSVLVEYLHGFERDARNWAQFLAGVDRDWLSRDVGVRGDQLRRLAPQPAEPASG